MKQLTIQLWMYLFLLIAFVACDRKSSGKQFELSGTITNNTAKTVYLEEIPPGSNQPVVIDSFAIRENGSYNLKAEAKEPMIYNLRLDKSSFPIVAVINDVPKITLNVTLKQGSNEFAEKYEIQGSPASQQMKDYMYAFNDYLQQIFPLAVRADSLRKLGMADSVYDPIREEWKIIADKVKNFTLSSISKTDNPALFIFELGYYQSSADQRGFGLQRIPIEEEIKLFNDAMVRFPGHKGLMAVRSLKEAEWAQLNEMNKAKWVGKPAPDFSLPDVNGNQISLSSFKGKYVLVDFWASWCGPCRAENPNVVKAFNKFRDKNFEILGVSLDHPGEKNKWLDAIRKDNLTWKHVSDLKGWESVVVPMYDFGQVGIPYNILVDPEGIVIAERLNGRALESKLGEVLK
jgi:peroxiredoxin